jgi:subtilisin family serine protease
MKTYNVILHKGVDYQSFWDDMERDDDGGKLHIPNRRVDSPNLRPNSPRQTWYTLSDEEAEIVRQDERVMAVEIPPEFRDDIVMIHHTTQTGDFTKTSSDSGQYINWGLIRHKSKTNNYGSGTTTSEDYTYTLDGTGVDVVIQDSGLQINHPEFETEPGQSRIQQLDWYQASGITGTQNENHYRDLDGHGTHVAGIVAGKNHGVAKGATVYSVKVNGLEAPADGDTGISITDCFDVIKGWHNNKGVTSTGFKTPTVVNMSWGYGLPFNTVTSLTYRGVSYTDGSTTGNATYREQNYGLVNNSGSPTATYICNIRDVSTDIDVEEMIDAGIIVTIAAGNRGCKIDVDGGDDYNNFVVTNSGTVYYHRGSSPYSDRAIMVGNMDSTTADVTNDQKATSSECGPGVDIYAAGTNIMSCTSTTNRFTDAPYYFNGSYRQCNISGTSMAAPQVAGIAALLLQQSPGAKPETIKSTLESLAGESIYTSSNADDWTDRRSLLGGTPKVLFNKDTNSNPIILQNVTTNLFSGGVQITTK